MIQAIRKTVEALRRMLGMQESLASQPRDELDRVMLATTWANEFSWLLIDADGAVGVFMMAGRGYVPDALLRLGQEGIKRYNRELMNALVGRPNQCNGEGEQIWSLDYEDVLCAKGFFVFDWDERLFQRVRSPREPVQAGGLQTLIAPFASGVPTAQVRLKDCETIEMSELIECRKDGDVPSG